MYIVAQACNKDQLGHTSLNYRALEDFESDHQSDIEWEQEWETFSQTKKNQSEKANLKPIRSQKKLFLQASSLAAPDPHCGLEDATHYQNVHPLTSYLREWFPAKYLMPVSFIYSWEKEWPEPWDHLLTPI